MQPRRNDHEIVGEDGRADEEFESLTSFDERAFHAAPTEQHGDPPLDAGPKPLPLLEGFALLDRFALRTAPATRLWNARTGHPRGLTGLQVRGTEEPAVRTVEFRSLAKRVGVALERRRDMILTRDCPRAHGIG